MLCRDESALIKKALDSVKPFIDCWLIVDTGSTDGTQDIIYDTMKDIPGVLHERKWKGWSESRNESLDLARRSGCDWILILDADDIIQGSLPENLNPNAEYWVTIKHGNLEYSRPHLVNAKLKYSYKGCIHEYLSCDEDRAPQQILLPITIVATPSRRDLSKDVVILEEALKREPENRRYWFYYAQSLKDTRQYDKALDAYLTRASMGGWFEEVYYSLLQVAVLNEQTNEPEAVVIDSYLYAYECNPARSESLGMLCDYLNRKGRYTLSVIFAEIAKDIPKSNQKLFVDTQYYDWVCLDLFSVAAYYVGRYQESAESCRKLLSGLSLPLKHRARVQKNLEFAESKP